MDLRWWARSMFEMACEVSGQPSSALAQALNARLGADAVSAGDLDAWFRHEGMPPLEVWIATLVHAHGDFGPLVESLSSSPGRRLPGRLEDDVNRRTFLGVMAGLVGVAGGAGDPEPWERLEYALERPKRVDAMTVSHLERVTMTLEELEPQVSPAALLGPVSGHLSAITRLIAAEPHGGHRQALLSLAAESSALAGWLSSDTAGRRAAGQYFRVGLQAAQDAGDTALGAYLLGGAACQPSHEEDPERRLRMLADGSFGFSEGDATRATRAWLATLEAEAHQLAGNEERCLRSLDRAHDAIDSAGRGEDRPRIAFFDAARLSGEHGLCLARLGHADEARGPLESALANLRPDQVKTRPRLLAALGAAYAGQGEIEEACRIGTEALDIAHGQGVEPNLQDVRWLRRQLDPWAGSRPVRDFDERLRALG